MSVDDNINKIYMEVYKITKDKKLTVPFLFKPYDTNRKKIDEKLWCASAENKNGKSIIFSGYGNNQEDAMNDLRKKLLEG